MQIFAWGLLLNLPVGDIILFRLLIPVYGSYCFFVFSEKFLLVKDNYRIEQGIRHTDHIGFKRGTILGLFNFHLYLIPVKFEEFPEKTCAGFRGTGFNNGTTGALYVGDVVFAF